MGIRHLNLNELPLQVMHKVCIYGAGQRGLSLIESIKPLGNIEVACALDSFESGIFEGLSKIKIDDFSLNESPVDYILIASAFEDEIYEVLKNKGLDKMAYVAVFEEEDKKDNKKELNEFFQNSYNNFKDIQPPYLSEKYLAGASIVPSRESILYKVKKDGVLVEVGTQTGEYAKRILDICKPKKLHIIDINYEFFDFEYFNPYVESGVVEIHEGDSSTLLSKFDNKYFDMIYVDGDHSYNGVIKDLDQSVKKIKDDGMIICNDYTIFSPFENVKYGIVKAVNEICIEHDFKFSYLGLHPFGYHDVAIGRI